MSKKDVFFIGFLFSLPVFISITDKLSIKFSRYAYDIDSYILTIPLSFAIITILLPLFFSVQILKDQIKKGGDSILRYIFLLMPLLVLISLAAKFPAHFFIFIYSIFFYVACLHLFRKISPENYFSLIKYLFYFQVGYGISSHLIVNYSLPSSPLGTLIPNFLIIYNYEQYYSFGSALCASILIIGNWSNSLSKVLFAVAAFYVSKITENTTSQLFLMGIIFLFLLSAGLKNLIHANLKNIFLSLGLLFSISIPFFAWLVYEYFPEYVGSPSSHGLWARIITHHHWIEAVGFFDILLPLTSADWFYDFGWQPHHQLYNSLFYGGIFYLILNLAFNLSVISKTYSRDYIVFGFFYFFVGSSLEPLTHPFLFLQFYLLAAASHALKRQMASQLKSNTNEIS